jgi:NitT/TauT family transport system substrate-binding protein
MRASALLLVALVLGLGLSCRASDGPSAPASGAGLGPPAPIKLRAAYTSISGAMAPLWAAYEGGFFEREGLAVEVSAFPSGNEGIQALMANEVDFLQIAGSTTAAAALGGGDVVVLATTVRTIVTSLVARPEIQQPEDLRGKAVGISRLGTSIDTAARVALRHLGLEPEREVAIIQAGSMPNILGAMEAGRVQAGVLSYPSVTQARKLGYRLLLDIGTLGIPYASTGVSTRRSLVAEQPEVVRRYLRAQLAAIQRLRTDKPFALELFRQYLRTDDPDVLEETYEIYALKYIECRPYPDERSMQGVLDELAATNPHAAEANPRDFYDDRFVRELDESGYLRSLGC